MGCAQNSTIESFKVANLNFSGICLSPFEYHDSSISKQTLSCTFGKILKKVKPDQKFSWQVGKIDLKLQRERYTPIYRKDVCVIEGKLIKRDLFDKLWKEQFTKNADKLKDKVPTQDQIDQANLFDWLCYLAILNFLFNRNGQITFEIDPTWKVQEFVKFLNTMHSKSYLNNTRKMEMVNEFISKHNIDIMFLQEAETRESQTWRQIINKNFTIVQRSNSESKIFYRSAVFHDSEQQIKVKFEELYKDKLNFNKDTVYTLVSNRFLLVSSHLSSKQNINATQAKQMNDVFDDIKKLYPGIEIIVGTDSNHFIDITKSFLSVNDRGQKIFDVYPRERNQFTTIKKRTKMQLQTRKADQVVRQIKDQIITTRKINVADKKGTYVGQLDRQQADEDDYLPNEEHPFDHFLVVAEIIERTSGQL